MNVRMKDIADYFISPTKARASPKEVKNEGNQDQNVNTENKLKGPLEAVKEKGKTRTRKKRRKPTDPEVQNVTELLTNNLKIISPNSSTGNQKSSPTTTTSTTTSTENEDVVERDEANKVDTPKVNAFQFLMNSRNSVIGQNSEGKVDKDDNDLLTDDKQKREARKDLFKNWADQKGASKRKRDEEDIDKTINFKMKRRAKRLKKLLQIEDKNEGHQHFLKRKRRVKKLSSSESENSNDLNIVNTKENSKISGLIEILEDNAQDIEISPIKKHSGQNNLLNFLGIINKEDIIEVFDESDKKPCKDIIKIKMFTPKSNDERKKDVDCITTDDSSPNDNKVKQKKKKPKTKDKKMNDSMEDFSSPPDGKKIKTRKVNRKQKDTESIGKSKLKGSEDERTNDLNIVRNDTKSVCVIDDDDDDWVCLTPKARKNNCNYVDQQGDVDMIKQANKFGGRVLRKRNIVDYKSITTIEMPKNSMASKYEQSVKKKPKTSLKVAPVFLKSTPKPKVDPNVIEARNRFLMSGIPDSMKKTIEKQKSIEEKEYDVFPSTSHVQQKCDSNLWDLPNVDLSNAKPLLSPLSIREHVKCEGLVIKSPSYEVNLTTDVDKVKHIKKCLQELKLQNPDYPVFKVFRHIHEKSGKTLLKRTPKRHSKKSQRKSAELQSQSSLKDHEMWTEKYNPRSSEEILGNYRSVNELRKWLEIWMNYSREINARKRRNSNSESEFESTDCDSRDSSRLPGNTMILYGPCGSGKTSSVYAIAKELGFNVLELNASTKRTGKRLLQELQEATQSHQVRKAKINSIIDLTKAKKNASKTDQNSIKKMCILLIEDIDLIFDQDEGFLSSLSQLIGTSKRPIILTTTDNSPPHVQKFIGQYECISFMPLSLQCLAIWLQIVCLVEGLVVDKNDVGNLLEYNRGDIRRTLLELQFWCQSGGQLERNRVFPLKTAGDDDDNNVGYLKAPDEELQIELAQDEANNKEILFVHKHCVSSFEIFRLNEEYSIPQNMDLGLLWWNVPNILDAPKRLQRQSKFQYPSNEPAIIKDNELLKLKSIVNLYDSIIEADCLFKKVGYFNSNEPVVKNWSAEILDSQELSERVEECDATVKELACDLSHNLINGCVESYKRLEGASCALNMALPDASERRRRANQHLCEDYLKSLIPLSNDLDRKSIALDYLPAIREIARSEERRAAANTKRGNRFRHYLKDFNVDFKQSSCKLACNILYIE